MKKPEEIKNELIEKAQKNKIITELIKRGINFTLVGGAVSDIYLEKVPRDYDFIEISINSETEDFEYMYETKFSTTYSFLGETVQLLKKQINSFPFKVQKISIVHRGGELVIHNFDYASLSQKRLIPNWDAPYSDPSFLYCLPKWKRKGFEINDVEYFQRVGLLLESLEADKGIKKS